MNRYAVAVLSAFDNENTVQLVESSDEVQAVIDAVVAFNMKKEDNEKIEQDTRDWLNGYSDIEDLLDALFNGDLMVSKPVLFSANIQILAPETRDNVNQQEEGGIDDNSN